MSDIKKLFKQSSHYFTGHLLAVLTVFISFPIFTRIFSISDYGVLNLISSTLVFMVAFSKFGLNNASIRFYEEFKSGKRGRSINQFYSTLFLGSVLIAGSITFLFWFIVKLIPANTSNIYIFRLLSFVAVLIFIRCTTRILMNFLRAEQRTKTYNLIGVIAKWSSLGLSIFFVFYFIKGLYGLFFGMILTELIIVLFLGYKIFKKHLISFAQISLSFLKESIKYGLPLIAFEFAAIILMYGDRFLIQYYLGSKSVGFYSAGYNLPMYVSNLFVGPLGLAISPIYMNIWTNKGVEETKRFLSKALKYFLLIAIPVIFGLIAIDKEAISFLASIKYLQSYVIVPYVIIALMIFGTYHIFGAGLYIYKKTYLLAILILASGFLNIIINMILIPRLGIVGAAVATLIAYLILICLIVIYAFRQLSFKIDYIAILQYILFSLIMFLIIKNICLDGQAVNLILKIGAGALIYFSLITLFDKDIRRSSLKFVSIWIKRRNAALSNLKNM